MPPEVAGIALDDADGEIDSRLAGCFSEAVGSGGGHFDGAVPVCLPGCAPLRGAAADDGAEGQAARVGGDEGFGEEDELSALGGGFLRKAAGFFDGGFAVEEHGGSLDDGDGEGRGRLDSDIKLLIFYPKISQILCSSRAVGSNHPRNCSRIHEFCYSPDLPKECNRLWKR